MRIELTRRGDYAVRAMLALAEQDGVGPLSARVIAERMDVPVRFLPHVLGDLRRAGLVSGRTGRGGGYELARPATGIDLLGILEAVETDHPASRCVLRGGPCGIDGTCAVHDVFSAAASALRQRLESATLASLAARAAGGGGVDPGAISGGA